MGRSNRLTGAVRSARDAIRLAEAIAHRHVGSAQVGSVAMQMTPRSQSVVSIDVGVFAHRRRPFGGGTLWSGFVRIDNRTGQADFLVGGEYGAKQLAQLSAIPGSGFPPEPLDADAVTFDVPDVLRLAAEQLALKGAVFQEEGDLQLLLRRSEGRQTWRLQHAEARGLRVYVLIVDAGTGEIAYDRLPPGWGLDSCRSPCDGVAA